MIAAAILAPAKWSRIMSSPLPVAVIGAGHMGRHHVRHYSQMPAAKLVAVIDKDLERAKALAEPLGVRWAADLTPDLGDIAAVSVAVPTVAHLAASKPLLERGIGFEAARCATVGTA